MKFGSVYEEELCDIWKDIPGANRFDGKSVLVTGATGTIGQMLVDALAWKNANHDASIRICAAGRSMEKLQARFHDEPGVECLRYDAQAPFSMETVPEYIVHAACSAHPKAYVSDPVGIMRANLTGTLTLLDMAKAGSASFLFLSSGEIYGENPVYETGFTETDSGYIDPVNPRSCYPESKRASETLCACYAAQYGVRAMIARLSHTYGATVSAENTRADSQFLQKALSGEDIVMKSAGSQVRSFTHVADCVRGLLVILLEGQAGQAYNVSNPASVASIREYAATLARLSGVSLRFEIPSGQEAAGYTKVTRAVLNSEKLRTLGYAPRYDLETGLAHTLSVARAYRAESAQKGREQH